MNAPSIINLSAGERRLLDVLNAQGACGAPAQRADGVLGSFGRFGGVDLEI